MSLLAVPAILSSIGSVAVAILILLAMVTVHEFGHYVAGKLLKFKINEFSIGFGPALFKKRNKKTDEIFSLRLFPLGGYCAFDGEEDDRESPQSFNRQKPWKRIVVLFSGAFMNYVFAMMLIFITFFSYGQVLYMTYQVEPDEAYVGYSFQDRDVILECEGRQVYLTTDLIGKLEGKSAGDLVEFTVSRVEGDHREIKTVEIMLRADVTEIDYETQSQLWTAMGIRYDEEDGWGMRVTAMRLGFFETIGRSFVYSGRLASSILSALGQLITGKIGLSSMGGPVTIIQKTSEYVMQGFFSFLNIASNIGVNLAVFNLLPIPALDGSKIVFTLIEWIFKKPVNRKVEAIIHTVGILFLFGFAVLVDLLQFL